MVEKETEGSMDVVLYEHLVYMIRGRGANEYIDLGPMKYTDVAALIAGLQLLICREEREESFRVYSPYIL
jgi:hypothetical protein